MLAKVSPDNDAAAAFGRELQKDYSTRKTRAIVDRIDTDAVLERVFSSRIKEVADYGGLKARWEKELFQPFARNLEVFDQFSVIVPDRVILLADSRVIECLLLTPSGGMQQMHLRLIELPGGEVRIADLRLGGARLEFAHSIRHTLLLQRFSMPMVRDEEEISLEDFGKTYGLTVSLAFSAMAKGDHEQAFKHWSVVPPAMQATRIWRDLRDRMALGGGGAAMRDLERAYRETNEVDPFLRYLLASQKKDHAAALAAIDELLVAQHELGFFRATKAGILLEMGRDREALELARDIVALTPLASGAYFVGVQAAVKTGQRDLAIGLLRQWSGFVTPSAIDHNLESATDLAAFRASGEYVAWLKSAQPAATSASR